MLQGPNAETVHVGPGTQVFVAGLTGTKTQKQEQRDTLWHAVRLQGYVALPNGGSATFEW